MNNYFWANLFPSYVLHILKNTLISDKIPQFVQPGFLSSSAELGGYEK